MTGLTIPAEVQASVDALNSPRFTPAVVACSDLGVTHFEFTHALQIAKPATDGEYRVCIASVLSTFGRFTDQQIDLLVVCFKASGGVAHKLSVARAA